jgi:hypothetical protein
MSTSSTPNGEGKPRDAAYWSGRIPTAGLQVSHVPSGALGINVQGRQVVGPLQGFGQMWQKTYVVHLKGATVTPAEVIKVWKENFSTFWPQGNRFFAPLTGIAPGEVALLSIVPGGMPLSTGVLVLYADDESFTLMTPQGHVFAGWITFSAYKEDEYTVVQVQLLIRANDPVYELGLRFGGHKKEDTFWQHTLRSVAAYFDVDAPVETQVICVDPKIQWSQVKNIWHNSAIRTMIYIMTAPVRWVRRKGRKSTSETASS